MVARSLPAAFLPVSQPGPARPCRIGCCAAARLLPRTSGIDDILRLSAGASALPIFFLPAW